MIPSAIFEQLQNSNEPWLSISLGVVNGSPVNARLMNNVKADFHSHPDSEEFFLVLDGQITIDCDGVSHHVSAGQSFTIPKGLNHRTRTSERSIILVIGGH